MGTRESKIPQEMLDLIKLTMMANRATFRALGEYVKTDGNVEAAKAEFLQPVSNTSISADDECPPGYHLDGGICVPD